MEKYRIIKSSGYKHGGENILVDAEDYETLSAFKWHVTSGYAVRSFRDGGKSIKVRMHRSLMPVPDNMFVDHINGNRLDNRKENLRVCTKAENARNRKQKSDNRSGYKGVHKDRRKGKWFARVSKESERYESPMFGSPEEAARAYDYLAHIHHGEFARLNFPEEAPKPFEGTPATSVYRGISWCARDKCWRAQFQYGGVRYNVGSFPSEREAYESYLEKYREVVGGDADGQ